MKAIVCNNFGAIDNLTYSEIHKPEVSPGQLLIRVLSCAINYPDTLIVQGKYQFKPELPFSPGGEVCGIIEAIGEGVNGFDLGDRVIAGTTWGGMAEYVIADPVNTFVIQDIIPSNQAAGILVTYGTTYHALVDKANAQAGDSMLVLGAAGGLGTAAIQLGKLLGLQVIAAASSEEKLKFCKEQGADLTLNYEKEDLKSVIKDLTDGRGVDIIFDPVGGKYTEPAFRGISWGGKHLILGFTNGEIPSIAMNLPLLKSASLVGVFWSSFWKNFPEKNRLNLLKVLHHIAEGRLNPVISQVYSMREGAKAIHHLQQRMVLGKVVVEVSKT